MELPPQDWFDGTFDADYLAIYHTAQDPAVAEKQAWGIARALGLKPGQQVLDCPCGLGRHARVLAKAGFKPTGVDRSTTFIEAARTKAADEKVSAEWHLGDMRQLPDLWAGRFDGAYNAFTSFGYFDEEADNRKVLAELARVVKPGGRVFLETSNALAMLARFTLGPEKAWFRGRDCLVLETVSYDWRRDCIVNAREVRFDDGRRRVMPPFRVRAYRPRDLVDMGTAEGLDLVEVCGEYDGSAFQPLESPRMVVLFEKPA